MKVVGRARYYGSWTDSTGNADRQPHTALRCDHSRGCASRLHLHRQRLTGRRRGEPVRQVSRRGGFPGEPPDSSTRARSPYSTDGGRYYLRPQACRIDGRAPALHLQALLAPEPCSARRIAAGALAEFCGCCKSRRRARPGFRPLISREMNRTGALLPLSTMSPVRSCNSRTVTGG